MRVFLLLAVTDHFVQFYTGPIIVAGDRWDDDSEYHWVRLDHLDFLMALSPPNSRQCAQSKARRHGRLADKVQNWLGEIS